MESSTSLASSKKLSALTSNDESLSSYNNMSTSLDAKLQKNLLLLNNARRVSSDISDRISPELRAKMSHNNGKPLKYRFVSDRGPDSASKSRVRASIDSFRRSWTLERTKSETSVKHRSKIAKFFKKLNPQKHPAKNGEKRVLFEYPTARMTAYDLDRTGLTSTIRQGSLLAEGPLQIYQLEGSQTNYLVCGGLVHPVMRMLRVFRTGATSFVLPLYNPERYWKLDMIVNDDDIEPVDLLIVVFTRICEYKDLTSDSVSEFIGGLTDSTADLIGEDISEENIRSKRHSREEINAITVTALKDKESMTCTVSNTDSVGTDVSDSSIILQRFDDVTSERAGLHTPRASDGTDSDRTLHPVLHHFKSFASDDTYSTIDGDGDRTLGAKGSLRPIGEGTTGVPTLEHPTPVRPESTVSSLDSILYRFDSSDDEIDEVKNQNRTVSLGRIEETGKDVCDNRRVVSTTALRHRRHISAWMDPTDSRLKSRDIRKRFSLTFKEIQPDKEIKESNMGIEKNEKPKGSDIIEQSFTMGRLYKMKDYEGEENVGEMKVVSSWGRIFGW